MIKLEHVNKAYRQHQALDDVSVSFDDGQTTVIVGPSGSGKSTLLRTINLLTQPDSGTLSIDDLAVDFAKPISSAQKIAMRKKTGMVFQNWNLFPNLTVRGNIMEGPTVVLKQSKTEAAAHADELLKSVDLLETADRYPNQLSGGQQQRISICRALAMQPECLLLDEPTSALDPEMETQVLRVLLELAKQKQAMVVVTHNMVFARAVAERIVFVENGRIRYDGSSDGFFNATDERIRHFLAGISLSEGSSMA
ncbi:amino acid ABC transporter ATP-binding protein [Lactobacillus selangorensis]|uniref:amino acid ABC transporter ATP-binding protein n=1 Tax=Lactobacillus selangorensis TaxID=81857 RepID=UPI00070D0133|nr:amino acid ABC transporter ATP-binding protein [Lactobacillus selangorensis]